MVLFMDDGAKYIAHWRFEASGGVDNATGISKS
jgi:hypothetical protein